MKVIDILEKPLGTHDSTMYRNNTVLGLTTTQAEEILKVDGENVLAAKKKKSSISVFMGQFKDIMILILLASTVFSVVMGEIIDAVAIITIVILNAVLGFVQEYRTEKTLEALKKISAPTAEVYRDGIIVKLSASKLVCGDVIRIEAGDKIPCDAELISAVALECDEAVLTGESVPVGKTVGKSAGNSLNQETVVYMGSTVTKGHGTAKVIATGVRTQMGLVSNMLSDITEEQTPLQKRLGELGKTLAAACLIICVIVSIIGVVRGFDLLEMILTGISLAVAAIPEGLPATVTISLALAVRRIYKQKALVNKLHSVETLGCTNVICSDKTGTLTQNKMTVTDIYLYNSEIEVTGSGLDKAGDFRLNGAQISPLKSKPLNMILTCGVVCNNAQWTGESKKSRNRAGSSNGGIWQYSGDPTEAALLISGAKGGIDRESAEMQYTKTDEIPFDSATRFMAVITKDSGGNTVSFAKGAVDVILRKSSFILTETGVKELTSSDRKLITQQCDKMTGKALRLLGFAYKDGKGDDGYIFIGIQGMSDPLRPEIKRAVRMCGTAGIRTVMITGDHKNTAAVIARQAGILKNYRVITGAELAEMSDEKLSREIDGIAVFARVSPSDKLRIVRTFKAKNYIVAMTGDGVNDAPAVKEATIGVSMGITGTDVTKEAAQIILLDDNFATLVNAVEQGRTIYSNIRKFMRYMLSCNIGEVLTVMLAMILGFPTVLAPIQILLINLITDSLPAIALGMEPPTEDIMHRKPRKSDESVFADGILFKIIIRGIIIGVCTLGTFSLVISSGGGLLHAQTAALFTLGLSQLVFVFECKSEKEGWLSINIFNNVKLIIAVLISLTVLITAVYFPALQLVFGTMSLAANQIFIVIIFSAVIPNIMSWIGRKFS